MLRFYRLVLVAAHLRRLQSALMAFWIPAIARKGRALMYGRPGVLFATSVVAARARDDRSAARRSARRSR